MVLELIREENISKYLGLIAGEDLFDMRSGSATCFGVYDEEADIAVSTLSASIYPDYIRIRRLYTIPEYRNRGIATELHRLIACNLRQNHRFAFGNHLINQWTDIHLIWEGPVGKDSEE